MVSNLTANKEEYETKCRRILNGDPSVRFAGLINNSGDMMAGGYKKEVEMYLDEERQKEIFCEVAARVNKRKRYNSELGHVRYSASRRENVVIMSFPVYDSVLLIITDPWINIDKMAYRIMGILDRQYSEFLE